MRRPDARNRWNLPIAILLLVALAGGGEALGQEESRSDALPQGIGAGKMFRRDASGWTLLPVLSIDVRLSVTGLMVHGRVTQNFHNPSDDVIETLYAFPLPDRAAVHRMEMRVGQRRIESVIREKERARAEYEQAKQTGRKAALLDQHRPNLFVTRAANVNPGETLSVTLEYDEELEYADGRFELVFPLTYTPRFHPPDGKSTTAGPEARFVEPGDPGGPRATLVVQLNPGMEVSELVSDSHEVESRRIGDRFEVVPAGKTIRADRDFRLRWEPDRGVLPTGAAFLERRDAADYLLLMLLPPLPESDAGSGMPTETLFVVDVSGSMDGPSIEQARQALLAALDRLRPEDRFNLIKFNDQHEPFRSEFRQADAENLDAARGWVRELNAGGGTMIYPALMQALAMAGESRSSHAQRVVFVTDGAVGNEQEVLRALAGRLGSVRLHALGIGRAPNAHLMRKIASLGHGLCAFISETSVATNRVDAFFRRLDRPVLTDVEIEWEGLEVEESFPLRLSDLHAGEPLLISARLRGGSTSGRVTLRGHSRTGFVESETPVLFAGSQATGVAARWARTKVTNLMDSLHEGADPEFVRGEVVSLALEHRLVTRYTSLIAVEQIPSALGDSTTVPLASALPRAGTDGPRLRLLALLFAALGGLAWISGRILRGA